MKMYSTLLMPWIYLAAVYVKCRRRDPKTIEMPTPKWEKNTNALLAASSGNWWYCFQLLDNGADVEYSKKYTMLMHAVFQNNFYAAQRLLEDYDANVNRGTGDCSPLIIAVHHKNYAMVKLLLDHGARTCVYANKYAPLFFALRDGTYSMVRLLLEYGADPNEEMQLQMCSPNKTTYKLPAFYVMACTDRDDLYDLVQEFGIDSFRVSSCGCNFHQFAKAVEANKVLEKIEKTNLKHYNNI